MELREAALKLMAKMKDVKKAIDIAWTPIPEPRNELERLEYRVLQAKRKVGNAIATVDDSGDYQAIAGVMADAADDLDGVARDFETLSNPDRLFRVFSPYFGQMIAFDTDVGFQVSRTQRRVW